MSPIRAGLIRSLTVLALVGMPGCTGEEGSATGASPSGSLSPSPSPTAVSVEQSDSTRVKTRCRARQQATVEGIAYPMQEATDDLMRSVNRTSPGAARRVAARAEIAREAVLERCDRLPPKTRWYVATARRRAGAALTHADLDAVMSAYTAWAGAVGEESQVRQLLRMPCLKGPGRAPAGRPA